MTIKHVFSIIGLMALISTLACSKAHFTSEGTQPSILSASDLLTPEIINILGDIPSCEDLPANSSLSECIVIKDSFERDQILQNDGLPSFGWSKIIDDQGGLNGLRVDASIYHEADMGVTPDAITGPATDEKRALYFTGRKGGSVHSIFIVSKPLDLTSYNTLMIGYEFLAVDLEIWNWNKKTGQENIRLEVCEGDFAECEADQESDKWVVHSQSVDNAGDGLNGHDHVLSDWSQGFVNVDLSKLQASTVQQLVFRIAVTVDEGFNKYENNIPLLSSNLIDGVALDNVVALASKRKVADPDDGN